MSCHNMPLCVPPLNGLQPMTCDVTMKCMHQHATMVDYFMHKEMSRNGWFVIPTPSYPETNACGIDEQISRCDGQGDEEEITAEPTPKEVEDPKIYEEKPLWINGGRVFKNRHTKKINQEEKSVEYENMHGALEDEEEVEHQDKVDEHIDYETKYQDALTVIDRMKKENKESKKKFDEMAGNASKHVECYEIEKMIVSSLEQYLKALEQDCSRVLSEGDEKIQELQKARYQSKIKEHHRQKEMAMEKQENKRLQKELKISESKRKELQNAMAEMEAEAELMIDLKEENDNFRFQNSIKEKELKCSKEKHEAEIKRKEKDQINLREKLEIQEAEAKGLEKDVKEWKSKYKAECQSSEELREKLKHSEDLHEFLAPHLEQTLREKEKVRKKGYRHNPRR